MITQQQKQQQNKKQQGMQQQQLGLDYVLKQKQIEEETIEIKVLVEHNLLGQDLS